MDRTSQVVKTIYSKFCQHLIFGLFFRACVLPLVFEHLGEEDFWADSNLGLRERDCLQSIYSKLQNGFVADMFFPQVIFSSFLCLVGQLTIFPVSANNAPHCPQVNILKRIGELEINKIKESVGQTLHLSDKTR